MGRHKFLRRFEHSSNGCTQPVVDNHLPVEKHQPDVPSYTLILIRWKCCDKWAIRGKKLLVSEVPHFGDNFRNKT